MYKIFIDFSTILIGDIISELCILYDTRSTFKIEEDANGSLDSSKKKIRLPSKLLPMTTDVLDA